MKLNNIFLKNHKSREIIKQIKFGENLIINGLNNSRLAFFIGNMYREINKTILLITYDSYSIDQFYEDLLRMVPSSDIMIYPDIEALPHEQIITDFHVIRERLQLMEEMIFNRKRPLIILTTGVSLLRYLMPVEEYKNYSFSLKCGEEIELKEMSKILDIMGYERVNMVEETQQFSIRGGIIDIFPITQDKPYRIELFGDEIDSIREFDPDTQRSLKNFKVVNISPSRELLLNPEIINRKLPLIQKDYMLAIKRLKTINRNDEAEYLKEKMKQAMEKLNEIHDFPGYEQYLPYFYDKPGTAFDYIGEGGLIFFDQAERVWQRVNAFQRDIQETQTTLLEQGSIIPSYADNFLTPDIFKNIIKKYQIIDFAGDIDKRTFVYTDKKYSFNTKSVEPYHGKIELFIDRIRNLLKENYRIIITLNTKNKAKRIIEYLQEQGLTAVFIEDEFTDDNILVIEGSISEGFLIEDLNLVIYTEKELIGNSQRKKKQISNIDEGVKISTLGELSVGDYVVHENHGIGKYLGVKTLKIQGKHKDYLVLKYAGEDKLYVPTEQVNLVQKYIGADSAAPKLYKLGGAEWKKIKQKVKQSVQEMAIGLLELYAERETINGQSFSRDTIWQKEFEEAFIYEETPDQMKAIEEVKRDMEEQTPMDRLLCGDVGYGKTEVAIRAAFKAAMDGKQTAVLVPTTILAQQHFSTFKERIKGYPINVEMISRFKSKKEQKEILKRLFSGEIDIIIGTHRLISKDVIFSDLGLLIIDEEQRFGVTHKERLKEIKKNVDVFTLTATPIPRTLYMALVGVRDMSVIETPPENRYPIRTYIREYNEELIKEAIRRELGRKGQVYFVHNRVEDIEEKADIIKELVPEARVAIAHGQMNEHRLEHLMLNFYNREYDVLVCTTIIETGLDIPNVNTIIINRAEQMGLAQLHQLRGRVGRSDRVAYAHLLYEKDRILPEVAEKRLRAIKEFTSLGSGFKIAMRDLEIRGAGNLLGAEQHGHIAAIGFSLYCRLLENAIEELKGEKKEKEDNIEINLDIDAYIPDNYISDSKQKVGIYKKIISLKSEEAINDIIDELIDRFGDIPHELMNLIKVSRIKIKAIKLGIEKIELKKNMINCKFDNNNNNKLNGKSLFNLIEKYPYRIKVHSGEKSAIGVKIKNKGEQLQILKEILNELTKSITIK